MQQTRRRILDETQKTTLTHQKSPNQQDKCHLERKLRLRRADEIFRTDETTKTLPLSLPQQQKQKCECYITGKQNESCYAYTKVHPKTCLEKCTHETYDKPISPLILIDKTIDVDNKNRRSSLDSGYKGASSNSSFGSTLSAVAKQQFDDDAEDEEEWEYYSNEEEDVKSKSVEKAKKANLTNFGIPASLLTRWDYTIWDSDTSEDDYDDEEDDKKEEIGEFHPLNQVMIPLHHLKPFLKVEFTF